MQVDNVAMYKGGEELRRATAVLSGPSSAPKSSYSFSLATQEVSHSNPFKVYTAQLMMLIIRAMRIGWICRQDRSYLKDK